MAHVEVIVTQKILPPPDSSLVSADAGSMEATVKFVPPHSMTDAQIGNQVARIVRRVNKLADDDNHG